MVQVACKLPNGLTITHDGKTVTLNGANDSGNRFGFGFTDVKDMDIEDWLATDGKDLPAVRHGSIFVGGPDQAKERMYDASVQTGQEPLSPLNPGEGIEPTDETRRALDGDNSMSLGNEGPGVNQQELDAANARRGPGRPPAAK
jgi:hypothetical protein